MNAKEIKENLEKLVKETPKDKPFVFPQKDDGFLALSPYPASIDILVNQIIPEAPDGFTDKIGEKWFFAGIGGTDGVFVGGYDDDENMAALHCIMTDGAAVMRLSDKKIKELSL